MRGERRFPLGSCPPPGVTPLAKAKMPHKPKTPRGCVPDTPGTWHPVPCSLGLLSLEPLLYHRASTDENSLFHQPLWASKGQSRGPYGHTAASPNRVQAPHQPVQVNSLLPALPAQPFKGRAWGQTDRSETSSSPNTEGCLVKR